MSRRKRRLSSRVRSCVRNILAFLFTNVGVIVLVVGYTIAGAFMFQAIEGAGEMERVNLMSLERNNTAQYLWQNVTLIFNSFNDTALKDKIGIEIQRYQKKIVLAVRKGWDGGRSSRQWSFSSAFLYSLTVITTIGYGHLSPRTSWGKITTILYALLGMPLFLLYLSNLGTLLAQWFKCLYALVCLCRGCPGFNRRRVIRLRTHNDVSDSESIERPAEWRSRYIEPEFEPHYRPSPHHSPRRADLRVLSLPYTRSHSPDTSEYSFITFQAESVTVPISVCVSIMVGYILFGSMLFGMWEKWDKLDGAYFCFISLSSIGFGDFVPGERVYSPRIDTSFIACSLYLLLGMALVAMCFNLMQEQVIHYFAGAKRALKRICRCKR